MSRKPGGAASITNGSFPGWTVGGNGIEYTLDMPVQPAQVSLLMAIRLHGPITVGELAERLQLAQPTVTRALGTLDDFVEARRSPGDQRSKRLALAVTSTSRIYAVGPRRSSLRKSS